MTERDEEMLEKLLAKFLIDWGEEFEEDRDKARAILREYRARVRAAALEEAADKSEEHFWQKDRPNLYDWTEWLRAKSKETK